MNETEIEKMKSIDVRTVDINTLEDIDTIKVNKTLPIQERWKDFADKIKNPFCFICNGMVVKISYSETKESLEKKLIELCLSMEK